jgi:hypothetical protein
LLTSRDPYFFIKFSVLRIILMRYRKTVSTELR